VGSSGVCFVSSSISRADSSSCPASRAVRAWWYSRDQQAAHIGGIAGAVSTAGIAVDQTRRDLLLGQRHAGDDPSTPDATVKPARTGGFQRRGSAPAPTSRKTLRPFRLFMHDRLHPNCSAAMRLGPGIHQDRSNRADEQR
jgi:hypothetical protein